MKSISLAAILGTASAVCSPCYEKPPACTGSETSVQITGVTGDFCSPLCYQNQCPKGDGSFTATPSCVLETQGSSKPTQCALICTPGDDAACPTGASCQSIQGEGICTYPAGSLSASATKTKAPMAFASIAARFGARVVHESELAVGVTSSWTLARAATAADTVSAHIFLAHTAEQMAALDREWTARSDPSNPNYAKWLSASNLASNAELTPPAASLATVIDWLKSEGVDVKTQTKTSLTKDIVTVTVAAPLAAQLFGAKFSVFTTAKASAEITRVVTPYTLPRAVAAVVSTVGSIARFPSLHTTIRAPPSTAEAAPATWPAGCGAKCKDYVTPEVLTQAYSLGEAVAEGAALGSMAVAEFQNVYYDQMDMYYFRTACKLPFNVSVADMIGENEPKMCRQDVDGCLEALLDIQFIKGVAGGIPLTDVYSADYSLPGWVAQLQGLSDAKLPLINSVSYGNDEIQQTSRTFMYTTNAAFMKIGLRGVSILFASGDQGVWGRTGPDGTPKRFHPDFPASSPYVTAVGGTDFATKDVVGAEKAWTDGGGGFSATFAIPSWQTTAVASYLKNGPSATGFPNAKLFNATGRGYPDIAALGGQVNSYCVAGGGKGQFIGVAGTSASCPVAAGVFAKLNELRLAAKKPALGPLNQFIYSLNGDGFNDVKLGNNNGGGPAGFPAIQGWDAATGWGSPDFKKLSAAVLALP